MVRRVFLEEDEHAVTILRGLKHEEDFSDFTIKAEGNDYPVHRNIMAVASPYFKAMLKHDTVESRERKVDMKDVDFECVASCIDFIYSGSFDIPDGKIGELLHVAIMMQLDKVKEAVCKILDEELNAEKFYQTRSLAEMYQLQSILEKCKVYYNENFMAISAQPDFHNEEKSHLVTILKSKKMKLSEDDKLIASLRWAGNDPTKKKSLLRLVKCVKLGEVTKSYLQDLLRNDPIISNDFLLYKIMSDPLLDHNEPARPGKVESPVDESLILFDEDVDCLRTYNPATDEISKFHDGKFRHFEHFTAVSMDLFIYVLCENKSVHRLNFKDKNAIWERMEDMIEDHGWYPPAVAFSGSLVVVGSDTAVNFAEVVERFDPVANQWLRLQDRPLAIREHTLVSLDDSIYSIGGYDGSNNVATLIKFTPSRSKWVDLKPMKTARRLAGAVAVKQKIFVVGGLCQSGNVKEVECYDVASGLWTSLSPMIGANSFNVARHMKGWIYSIERFSYSNEIQKYDIMNDKWSKVEFSSFSSFQVYDCVVCR